MLLLSCCTCCAGIGLSGAHCHRATKTLVHESAESNPSLHSWLNLYLQGNSIPLVGGWGGGTPVRGSRLTQSEAQLRRGRRPHLPFRCLPAHLC